MSHKISVLEWIAIVLVIVGAVNWGLVGLFGFDLVAAIFGDMSAFARIIYVLVGIAALFFLFVTVPKYTKGCEIVTGAHVKGRA